MKEHSEAAVQMSSSVIPLIRAAGEDRALLEWAYITGGGSSPTAAYTCVTASLSQ